MDADAFVAEFDRLLAAHPEVGADGFADLCDPPPADRPEFRDFVLALAYLSKRAPDRVLTHTVALRASHALYEILLGARLREGGVVLAAFALGYDVVRLQEGGAWLQFPKDADDAR
jgi:hypothetical protein